MSEKSKLKKITYTSLIIAIVLVLRGFSYMISFGGGAGLRLSLAGFFTAIPALLFGPFFGGLSYGVIDILGYIIRPEGAYIPLLTLTEVLRGVMIGFLFKALKKANSKGIRLFFLVLSLTFGVFGIINHLSVNLYPASQLATLLMGLGKRTMFFTVGFEVVGGVSILIFSIDYIFGKFMTSKGNNDFTKILAVLFISNIIATTLNTFVIMMFTPSLSKIGFMVFYIPRLVEEIIVTILQSFVTNYLIKIYKRLS
jgi:ECF transporter S component (folate family)